MRKLVLLGALLLASGVGAQTLTTSIPKTCSPGGPNLYCYGVEVDGGGVMWIDWYPNGYNNNPNATHGFVFYNTPELLWEGLIQSATLAGTGRAGTSGTLTLSLADANGKTAIVVIQLEWVSGRCSSGHSSYACTRTVVVSSVTTFE